MPKGAYPAGRYGSRNSDGADTGANLLLKTSTEALATSVANNSGPALVLAMASPLNTAPLGVMPPGPPVGLSSTTNLAPPSQASIRPGDCVEPTESESTMKIAALPLAPPTGKPLVELKTCPVGLPPGTGTVRSSDTLLPWIPPLYTVANPELWSDTQSGVVGPAVIPQAFFRFGSVRLACCDAWLEMRFTLVNTFGGWPAAAAAGAAATSPAVATSAAKAGRHLLPRARWTPAPGPGTGGGMWRMKAPSRHGTQRRESTGRESPAGMVTPTTGAGRARFSPPAHGGTGPGMVRADRLTQC